MGLRLEPWLREFYDELAEEHGYDLSDVIRSALVFYAVEVRRGASMRA